MGRTKTISGGGGTNSPSSSDSNPASNTAQKSETRIKDLLKELYTLIHNVQDERARGEHNLTNISKTHERMQQEQRVTPYYKTKLKGLYKTAMQDAEVEAELLRKALDKISEIKSIREQRRIADSDRPKPIMRRGVLMSMLQQNASTLPLWVSKPGEKRHTLSKRRIVALPIWKANPETDPAALFGKGSLVLALYPQTTCFYRALIHEPPKKQGDEYSVLFEDTSYPDGYSPPLMVAQRYVILCKEDKKK